MKTLLLLLLTFPVHRVDSVINRAIEDSLIPGAVVCVVNADTVEYLGAYGYRALVPEREPMTVHTIFDMASVSKPTGAGTAALCLIKDGRLHADDLVRTYLSSFEGDATIRHLMTHTSGLPPYLSIPGLERAYNKSEQRMSRPDFLLDTICRCHRMSAPGDTYRYSCLNFITLQRVVEAITGQSLHDLRPYYHPLTSSTVVTLPCEDVAPTEVQPNGQVLRGAVHDPLARVFMLGVSGNAGVFMTASQLASWCVWLMSLSESEREAGCNAGLWTDEETHSLNHTGYTGTSVRLYPDRHRAVIILTNRVHPMDRGNLNPLRKTIYEIVK